MSNYKITKEFLIEQHINKNKSCPEIAKEFGFSSSGLRLAILRFGLPYKKGKNNQIIDRVNKKYGKYKVLKFEKQAKTKTYWKCVCECGQEIIISNAGLDKKSKSKNGCYLCRKKMIGEIHCRYIRNLKNKAKFRKIKYDIEDLDLWNLFLKQDRKCALSGLDLIFSSNYRDCHTQTSSLDRIDSNKDYTIDNVQWVHKKVNLMKQTLSQEEFIKFCKLIAERNK